MPRYAFGMRSTVEGTPFRAQMSLFAILGVGGTVREVGVSNTTDIAFAIGLRRFTDSAGAGASQTDACAYDESKGSTPCMTICAGHSLDGNVGRVLRQWSIGDAVGASVIWRFDEKGLIIQPGNPCTGIGPYVPTGAGQFGDDYIEWDERGV